MGSMVPGVVMNEGRERKRAAPLRPLSVSPNVGRGSVFEDGRVVRGLGVVDNFAEVFSVLNGGRRERTDMIKGLSAVGIPPKIAGFERLEWVGSGKGL